MCDECEGLDKKVEHFRRLASGITDQQAMEGIGNMIKEAQARKAQLHPERKA